MSREIGMDMLIFVALSETITRQDAICEVNKMITQSFSEKWSRDSSEIYRITK